MGRGELGRGKCLVILVVGRFPSAEQRNNQPYGGCLGPRHGLDNKTDKINNVRRRSGAAHIALQTSTQQPTPGERENNPHPESGRTLTLAVRKLQTMNILPRCSRLLPLRVAPREEEIRHRPVRVQGALVGVGRVQGQVALSSLAALAVRAGAREVREEADQGEEGVRARGGGAEPTLGRASHGKDRLRSEVQFR